MEYELKAPARVEDTFLGERFTFEAPAGRYKPKSDLEAAALARLAEDQPDICRPIKAPASKGKD